MICCIQTTKRQGWIFVQKPVNLSQMVHFKTKISSQKMACKSHHFVKVYIGRCLIFAKLLNWVRLFIIFYASVLYSIGKRFQAGKLPKLGRQKFWFAKSYGSQINEVSIRWIKFPAQTGLLLWKDFDCWKWVASWEMFPPLEKVQGKIIQ